MLKFCFYSLFAIVVLVATNAVAQSDNKSKAKTYLDKGDQILTKGDKAMSEDNVEDAMESYESALELYEKAYSAFESPKIFFPIALTEQKLGRFKKALKHYTLLLESDVELSEDVKKRVEDGVELTKDNLVGFVPQIKPDGATLYIDGKKIGSSPLPEIVYVTPGWHDFAVRKTGYKTFESEFDKKRGSLIKRSIALKMGGRVSSSGTKPPKHDNGKVDKPSRAPMWLGMGATVLLAGGATYTGLRALEEKEIAEDSATTEMDRGAAKDRRLRMAVTTDVLAAGAVLAGAFTLYCYLAKGKPSQEEHVVFAPYVGTDSGGWIVRGAF